MHISTGWRTKREGMGGGVNLTSKQGMQLE